MLGSRHGAWISQANEGGNAMADYDTRHMDSPESSRDCLPSMFVDSRPQCLLATERVTQQDQQQRLS
jgi:hypothetical protein